MRIGAQNLTEAELLAIILRTGTQKASALDLAQEVLALSPPHMEGLLGLHYVPMQTLQSIHGIGQVKAVKLKCLAELSRRMSQARAKKHLRFDRPETVAEYFMESLRHRATECVVLVSVDMKGHMLGHTLLSQGSVHMSLISPREIFMEALRQEAVNILLVHNHPSGDPTPSQSDRMLTRDVADMGRVLDIPLLDHIIIGDNCYASFKELSLI